MTMIDKNTAEHYTWGDNCDGWHLVKSPNLSVIQECVPVGAYELKHFHQHAEQFFFVLSGCATIEVDGQVHTLSAQQGLHVSAGKVHQLSNQGSEALHFIVTSIPPSHGDRVEVSLR
ncbi:cupin [Pseudoalteromonas lipolytica SCSIO 04301]|nr:cupin [Pseudoalteromonas lipolytica SCSIO 04301]